MSGTRQKWAWIGPIALAVLVVALSGCSLFKSATPTLAPQPDETEEPGVTDQVTDTQAPASEPTDKPAAVVTFTPTIAFLATITVDQVDVHTGPGYEHPVLLTIDEPITVRVIGINPLKTWFFILLPDNRQGWIPIEALEYGFDLNLLPVIKETPTPTTYGENMLVPPQLLGVTPASPSSPARGALSVTAIFALGILVLGASGALTVRGRRRSRRWLPRLLQTLISLL